jgi:hypothetical protein
LRRAFHETMHDPGFIAEAEKQRIEIREVDGEKIANLLDSAFKLPPDIVNAASAAMVLSGSAGDK